MLWLAGVVRSYSNSQQYADLQCRVLWATVGWSVACPDENSATGHVSSLRQLLLKVVPFHIDS